MMFYSEISCNILKVKVERKWIKKQKKRGGGGEKKVKYSKKIK